ncbi:hypothetical protein ACMT1E_05320 [Sphingomonas flavalba]|uniref:hypothetical protein n=1 Tax=Sphingomonas flavalba TaxID=2559804 RepID=UPI0039E049CA
MIVGEEKSFCRTCTGFCGVKIAVDEHGRVAKVCGDMDRPLTQGFACLKGLVAPEAHNGPQRPLHTMKRRADGEFRPTPAEDALDEVTDRLQTILTEDGPQNVSGYFGTMGGDVPARLADVFVQPFKSGDRVAIESGCGRIDAVLEAEPALRRGAVSMTHSGRNLPDDGAKYHEVGSNVKLLISMHRDLEPINAMPRMSAIPVNIQPVQC